MDFLTKNLKHFRILKKLSQEQFAKEFNVSRSRIASYEENRATPPIDFLIQLSEFLNISVDSILKHDLTSTAENDFININKERTLFPITIDSNDDELIELVPEAASAGYLQGYSDPEYIEHLNKIKLPFLPTGTHRAFPIKGDSMLPVKSGSYIVAKFIESVNFIQNGKTYIILSKSEGMVYKRVFKQIEEHKMLLMVSDNKKYDPYYLPVQDVLEIWEFTCSINTQEYEEHELKISSIAAMLTQLGVELEELKKTLN